MNKSILHRVKVIDIIAETPLAKTFVLQPLDGWQPRYQPGQFLTLLFYNTGTEKRRSYSLVSNPLTDNFLCITVKRTSNGEYSRYLLDRVVTGDEFYTTGIAGFFTLPEKKDKNIKQLFFLAAGSGITPVPSIIKTTLRTEPRSNFTLVYGNKNRASVIFFEELEGLKNKFISRFNFINILSRERTETALNSGRINTEKLTELNKLIDYKKIDETFICGPEEMIFCVKDFLETNGIDKKKIHFELFSSKGRKKADIRSEKKEELSSNNSLITIKIDGRSIEFPLSLNSDISILDAALKQGADLPFACKGGMCCTCKAKLLEGEVEMDVHWGLEHEEIEKGFILTCQSHPKTENVVVDFDIK